jgi:mannose-6-phosphate isomerase-like protein (cupin superfamily)
MVQTAHVDEVEKVKTGQGMTRFLIRNGAGEGPNIMIRYWGPETDIPVHAHAYAEMWYVLEGEVIFGDTTYTEGSCIYIPAHVPYGPARAPKGAALLRYADGAGGSGGSNG